MLLITVPFATEGDTVAFKMIVADALAASEANVTKLLLPDPPQSPPVASHEIKVVAAGRLSVTVTDVATFGPLLVTVIV